MLNALPIIGWLLSFIFAVSLSIPFYFIWNGLAPTYFYFIPDVYKHLPFWDTVGLFMIVPILKHMLVPKFISVTTSSSADK